jgi:hypothetical protein
MYFTSTLPQVHRLGTSFQETIEFAELVKEEATTVKDYFPLNVGQSRWAPKIG